MTLSPLQEQVFCSIQLMPHLTL